MSGLADVFHDPAQAKHGEMKRPSDAAPADGLFDVPANLPDEDSLDVAAESKTLFDHPTLCPWSNLRCSTRGRALVNVSSLAWRDASTIVTSA